MKQTLLFILLIPFYGFAQDDAKYTTGMVPEVDGKVVFEKTFILPSISDESLFDTAKEWADARFSEGNNRVVFSDKAKGDIAAIGEDYIVFSSTSLSLDRALMPYRILIHSGNEKITIRAYGIKYEYNVSYQREPEKYTAEEWITDKTALNKGKLNRSNGKFRKGTIDYVEELFANAQAAFSAAKPTAAPVIAATPATTSGLDGFKRINAENIPGNIIRMLSQDWMLITAGNDAGFNMMTASWGGLGYMFGKPVAFCFINPERHTFPLMEKQDYYTLTFYTEAYRNVLEYCGSNSGRDKDKVKETGLTPITTPSGSKAFNEAWMIIECRKLVSQSLSQESITNEEVRKDWIGRQINKMFVGEIINVWIK